MVVNMGLLSRRRKQPRIVKKRKVKATAKKISVKQLDPLIRVRIETWNSWLLETLG